MRGPTYSGDVPSIRLARAVSEILHPGPRESSANYRARIRDFLEYIADLEDASRDGFVYGLGCMSRGAQ